MRNLRGGYSFLSRGGRLNFSCHKLILNFSKERGSPPCPSVKVTMGKNPLVAHVILSWPQGIFFKGYTNIVKVVGGLIAVGLKTCITAKHYLVLDIHSLPGRFLTIE